MLFQQNENRPVQQIGVMYRQSATLLIILAPCCGKLLSCRGFFCPAAQWGFPADDFPFPAGTETFPAGDNRLPAKQESKNQLQDGSNSNRTGELAAGLNKKGRLCAGLLKYALEQVFLFINCTACKIVAAQKYHAYHGVGGAGLPGDVDGSPFELNTTSIDAAVNTAYLPAFFIASFLSMFCSELFP